MVGEDCSHIVGFECACINSPLLHNRFQALDCSIRMNHCLWTSTPHGVSNSPLTTIFFYLKSIFTELLVTAALVEYKSTCICALRECKLFPPYSTYSLLAPWNVHLSNILFRFYIPVIHVKLLEYQETAVLFVHALPKRVWCILDVLRWSPRPWSHSL